MWASASSPLTVPALLYRSRRRAHTLGPCPRGQLPAWLQGTSKLGTAAPRTGTRTKLGAVRPHSTDGCMLPTLQSQAPAAARMLGKRPFPPAPGAPRPHPILPCRRTAAEPCPTSPHAQRPQGSAVQPPPVPSPGDTHTLRGLSTPRGEPRPRAWGTQMQHSVRGATLRGVQPATASSKWALGVGRGGLPGLRGCMTTEPGFGERAGVR